MLEHLGPPMVEWWNDMTQPELGPELMAALVAGVGDELAGVDESELVNRRDAVLTALLTAKAQVEFRE